MAAKSGRYSLRSSQRATDNSNGYDTPQMNELVDSQNVLLSQSDQLDTQMENFLFHSFGVPYMSMSQQLNGMAKEENDPPLCRLNYSDNSIENEQLVPTPPDAPLNNWVSNDIQDMNNYFYDQEFGQFGGGGYSCSQDTTKKYKFCVYVPPQQKSANKDYISFNSIHFVKYNTHIPFQITLTDLDGNTSKPVPDDQRIRMSLRFTNPTSDEKIRVQRCDVHRQKDINGAHRRFPFTLNLSEGVVYDEESLAVTIPASTVVSACFHCYSSCAGGIDRQSVYMYFELLNIDGSVDQTTQFTVKVCANPSRDAPKEEERKRKEEEKQHGRARAMSVKSEASSERDPKGRKRKNSSEMNGREIKRMESVSPGYSMHTPSPGWNTSLAAPRTSATHRRDSKLEFSAVSNEGVNAENAFVPVIEDDDDEIFKVEIRGKKKYLEVMKLVKMLEQNERYEARHQEDNPFDNLTQITPETSIDVWLRQHRLHNQDYVKRLNEQNVYILQDICFTPTLFRSCGIPPPEAARLNMVYLNWKNVNSLQD